MQPINIAAIGEKDLVDQPFDQPFEQPAIFHVCFRVDIEYRINPFADAVSGFPVRLNRLEVKGFFKILCMLLLEKIKSSLRVVHQALREYLRRQ